MKRFNGVVFWMLWAPLMALAQPGGGMPPPQSLGNGLYRVGSITFDRKRQSLSVPGVVLPVDGPLEYIAVTRDGPKAYESLLRVDADAYEFNTVCLLIGLDPTGARNARYHFDENPVEGDPVSVTISWQRNGETVTLPASRLLRLDGRPVEEGGWVYTGSGFMPNNDYLAAMDGTLIGFVHDPASIIGHHSGLGLGDYGAVQSDRDRLPPPGSAVILTVTRGAAR